MNTDDFWDRLKYVLDEKIIWKTHPIYPNIRCSSDGRIKVADRKFFFKEKNNTVWLKFVDSTKELPVADLVLSTFKPCPGDRCQYKIKYKDGDFRNLRIDNIFWERAYTR